MNFILLSAIGPILLFVGAIYLGQDRMIYFPRSYGPEYQGVRSIVEEIPYDNGQGLGLAFYYGPKSPNRLWLFFGGNAMPALDWMDWLQDYRGLGTGFLLIDYPGYGESQGTPSPPTIKQASLAAYEEFSKRWEGSQGPSLHLLGISLGAAAALDFARKRPPKTLIPLAPFTSLQDMACRSVGKPLCYLLRHDYDNRKMLANRPPRVAIARL